MTAGTPRRILLILDDAGPGDALRIGFCFDAVRNQCPQAEIVLLVGEAAAPIMERQQTFDRVVVSRLYVPESAPTFGGRLRKLVQLARLLATVGAGYDLAITFLWGTTLLHVLARIAARRSIGYQTRLPWLLSSRLGRYVPTPVGHVLDQHRALLLAAGVEEIEVCSPAAVHRSTDDTDVQRLLDECGLVDSHLLVVLHPGSDWACQQWLPGRWATLADRLVADHGAAVVFTGVGSEEGCIEAIRSRMQHPSVSLAGRTTLPQLGALLSRARLCVSVDSVAYELTQAVGVPAVVLVGPSDPRETVAGSAAPLIVDRTAAELKQRINRCKEPRGSGCLHHECPMAGLRQIDVNDVLEAVHQQWTLGAPQQRAGSETRVEIQA